MKLFISYTICLFFAYCAHSDDNVVVEDDIVPYLEEDDDILTEFVDVSFDDVPFVEQADDYEESYHEFTAEDVKDSEWQPFPESKVRKAQKIGYQGIYFLLIVIFTQRLYVNVKSNI